MHGIPDFDAPLIARYLSGESTPDQTAAVQEWAAADPDNQARLTQFAEVWEATTISPVAWDTNAMWNRVVSRLPQPQAALLETNLVVSPKHPVRSHIHRLRRAPAILALSVLMATIGVATFSHVFSFDAPSTPSQREYITSRAERATVELPDGSQVVLGAASTLRYSQEFGTRDRTVFIGGEAYITAAANSSAPFIVHTTHATAQVLGTAFTVRAYPEDPTVSVAVVQGKVALRLRDAQSGSGTVLTPGDRGVLDPKGLLRVSHTVDTARISAWARGVLQFAQTPLSSVVTDLERWYGLRIVLRDSSMLSLVVTASFNQRTPDTDFTHLAHALGASYRRVGDTVIFAPQR